MSTAHPTLLLLTAAHASLRPACLRRVALPSDDEDDSDSYDAASDDDAKVDDSDSEDDSDDGSASDSEAEEAEGAAGSSSEHARKRKAPQAKQAKKTGVAKTIAKKPTAAAGAPKNKQIISRGSAASVAPGGRGFKCPKPGCDTFFDTAEEAVAQH